MPRKTAFVCLLILSIVGFYARVNRAQQLSSLDRSRAQDMLEVIAKDVSKHYYDPKLHGVDWDAKVREARQKIDNTTSLGMALSHIAAAVDTLDDSHTFFVPPQRSYRDDYGWQMQMVGNYCFVTAVRPGSDAEAKGLKLGDEVVSLNGYVPHRDDLWKMKYVFGVLRPQPGLRVDLRDPRGHEREVEVMAKRHDLPREKDLTADGIWEVVRQWESQERLVRQRIVEVGHDLLVLKLPAVFFTEREVDDMMGKARKRQALIVDLRGNPGGAVDSLRYLVGGVFDRDIKIGDQVGREKSKPLVAKSMGREPFTGKLAVLVDSNSASAAELFARIVQLEKRGAVLGDTSSGKVMEAKRYNYRTGEGTVVFYGASITEADLVMSDGKSLEHVGVTPDETILPTAMDLASGRDPVLARAATLLGAKLSPEDAGKFFPIEWPQD
jgi:C-terminal processing protease CtpA/Prc